MIYDCFIFNGEFDILELRLKELSEHVDRFVLVEANKTFKGDEKPFHFQKSDRFTLWNDQIIYVQVNNMPSGNDPWVREHHQREAMKRIMPESSDMVFISDVDEIPNVQRVLGFYQVGMPEVLSLHCRDYRFYFNYRFRWDWYYPKVVTGASFNRHTIYCLRHAGMTQNEVIPDAGWHFTYMGGFAMIEAKANSFSHWNEATTQPMIEKFKRQDPTESERQMLTRVEIDQTFPKAIFNHKERWTDLKFIKP